MINVIKEILSSNEYENVDESELAVEDRAYNINIFKNKNIESQIFIVIQILESELVTNYNNKDFVIEIANYFRESDIYTPDMDKNSSLIYCVKRDINSDKLENVKVKIEDDPFYFKKYVFAYSEAQADEFKQFCKQRNQVGSELIQSYILNTDNFSNFKTNSDNEKVYNLISELFIKIPIIAINFETNGDIKRVSDYMVGIQRCTDDEIEKLDHIVETLNDTTIDTEQMIEKILDNWGYIDLEDENE